MNSDFDNYSEDNILIIKGRFKSMANNLFGQFIILFNNKKHIDSYNVVVSTFSDLYDIIEPHAEWIKYQEVISDAKWQGKYYASMTSSLTEQLKSFSITDDAKILFEQVYNYDYTNLELTIFDLINRIIHDKHLAIETSIQEVAPEDYKKTQDEKDKPAAGDNKEDTDSSQDDGTIMLSCKPILAPVKGKPIYELRIGNIIMLKILPNSDRNNYYIDLFDLRDEENQIRSIPATVIDIKSNTGKNEPVEITTEIASGVFGKCIEDEKQVKLKMYDPETDGPLLTKDPSESKIATASLDTKSDTKVSSRGTMIMFLIFLFILLLFIVIIMLLW